MLFVSECDRIRSMDRVKGDIVTAGKFVTVWRDGAPVKIFSKYSQVNCVRYNEGTEVIYLACSDGSVIARSCNKYNVE